jgi:hypothetical protein
LQLQTDIINLLDANLLIRLQHLHKFRKFLPFCNLCRDSASNLYKQDFQTCLINF